MRKLTIILVAVLSLSAVAEAVPRAPKLGKTASFEGAPVGSWIGSAGLGLTFSPTLFLLSPQLEYVIKPDVTIGPLMQVGFDDDGVIFTATATARYLIPTESLFRPTVEGGLGMAFGSTLFSNSVGVHILFGFGVEYQLERNVSVGTMFRMNFMPPLKTFMLSWPLALGRFTF